MSYSVEHTNYFTEATESGGMFLANYYCPTCNINFDKEFEPITISCDVFYMYVSSSANIMWEIEASGGIGNYTYDIIMGEQSYSDESKYILTEIWSIENPFFAYTKEDTSHLMDIGYMFIITVYDSIGSVTYEIYFDNYWNSMPSHTIVKTPYTLN